MSDPHRPEHFDPAYASPPPGQQPWYGQPPAGGPPSGGSEPPEPRKSPKWLWILAGVAVLIAVALTVALVIANTSANKPATVSNATPTSRAVVGSSPTGPSRTSSTTKTTKTSPSETTSSGGTETVVYEVTGDGEAINITYLGSGGSVETEFGVTLPWTQEVSLTSTESDGAFVTVVTFGVRVTCTMTLNGSQVSQESGESGTGCTTHE